MKKIALLLILLSLLPNTVAINSYWVGSISLSAPNAVNGGLSTSIGEWDYISPFDPNMNPGDYKPGDVFVYDDTIWIVTGWFDPKLFLDEFGNVNLDYLRPHGPVQENTIYWRVYNTYYADDIVIHNGYSWVARHGGANAQEPGTSGNGWNRMSNEYFVYNTYAVDDIVIHNGYSWIVLHGGANTQEPGTSGNGWNRMSNEYFVYNTYAVGDVVSYNGIYYEAKHSGADSVTPGTDIYAWAPITNTYNAGTSYANNAYVLYDGLPWKSLVSNNTGHTPVLGSSYWVMALKY